MDIDDYEGGIPDDELPPRVNGDSTATKLAAPPGAPLAAPTATSKAPAAPTAVAQPSSNGPLADATNFLRIKLPLPHIVSAIGHVIQGEGFRLSIPATRLPTIDEQDELARLGGPMTIPIWGLKWTMKRMRGVPPTKRTRRRK